MIIKKTEIRKKGLAFITKLLSKHGEIIVSKRGKRRFVILPIERYEALIDAELERLINKAEEDYKAGRVIIETAEEHFKRLNI